MATIAFYEKEVKKYDERLKAAQFKARETEAMLRLATLALAARKKELAAAGK